ncbi:FHF complex subunit HOOK interacting protein 1A-like isoform X2 [Dicentrarchus labrax]|uniref:FHF complex subunit HOOK-interacting protein C-terminal domain-containing protein n=1 Tax=Dicentrarchus labrax TaxID=13489 RepID=A0A8C4ED90_DICLA|nr:FHF complex subunit HOOK interacting protein 1A-like isoform X2 [Dicentrarchus labrax]
MMASVVVGGNRKKSLTLRGVDPETCMIVFKNHWAQVVKILEKHEPGRSGTGALSFLSGHGSSSGALRLGPIPADEASAVQNYVEHMLFLLMEEEAGQGGAMGPILEFVVLEGVMERLFLWSLRRQFTEDMKLEQLRMYQMLLSQARQPLLHHKPVLRPLMMLLASCAGPGTDSGGVVEAELVLLLNQLCVALVKDPSVLELFFHTSEDQGAANFLLFSLLIPYTHRQGSVGQQARDALLLIMSLSASDPRVAQHIAENTYFCPVLATGLSGLYSSLPARLQVYSEDWHCLDQADWQQVPALVHFLHSLDFCSAVTKVAHPSIRSQLLGYIYNGFLVPVLAPALHKLTVEEVMTTTAYLDLFLRSIPEPALLQTFLSFILLHTHDNVHILDTLVSRVNTPFQLGTVSLALFRTLIGLFCEDVMLQLVFRYLIPCRHLSRKQFCSLKQRDCYSSSAASFLLLMPSWCPGNLHNTNTHSEHIHWPKGADLSVSDSVGYCRGSDFLMDVNYLHYLWDARQAISTSHRACQLWSAPYDGINPLPQEYRSDTPGDDIEDEEEIVPRAKSDSISSLVVTPPPLTLSPTLSSSDTISTGNQAGRASSALELEWDDIFADDDLSLSGVLSTTFANGSMTMDVDRCTSTPAPPLPPRHIQEMRRTATKLVHGSYVEESEFQDDVLVYNLVAQTDTKAAILERIMAANRRARGSISNGQRVSTTTTTTTIATMLTTTGRTVMETVNSIMSTRRWSEDAGKEERRWSDDYGQKVRRRSEDCGKELWRRKEEGEDEIRRMCAQGEPKGRQFFTNGFNAKHHIIDECDDTDEANKPFKQNCNHGDLITTVKHKHTPHQQHIHHNTQHPMPQSMKNTLPNGHSESEPRDPLVSATAAKSPNLPGNNVTNKDDFLSRYHKLMLSLGVEPDCDDITDDISTFRKRVRELRQKLEEEEEGLDEELVYSSLWDDREEEGEEEVMEEEEEEGEGEERRSGSKKGSRRHGVPFTGPFISVLLSRLENLLENSIAVNLLVTGILAQLASYPQPLLRSFLLSTDTHNLPNVRTLYQVLVSVNAQIERYVAARPEYPALVTQAWRFLLAKDQDSKFRECLQPQGGDIILDPSLPNGSVRNALALPPLSVLPPCPPIPPQAKSRVFAIVLYAEFLKELAAIAQEHSIALDCSSEE